jgi:hypothetical protein
MCLLRFTFPVVAIVALLSPAVVPTAHACSCLAIDSDEMMAETIGYYDAVVLGSISATRSGDQHPDRTYFEVDAVFQGTVERRIALDQDAAEAQLNREYQRSQGYDSLDSLGPDCSYTLFGDAGERYVLFLTQVSGGLWKAGECSSFPLAADYDYLLTPQERLEAIERVTSGGALGEVEPRRP